MDTLTADIQKLDSLVWQPLAMPLVLVFVGGLITVMTGFVQLRRFPTAVRLALGGAFVGQNSDRARAIAQQWPRGKNGGLIIVMDIATFAPPEAFRAGIDNLVRGVRETMEPVKGYQEATLPGTVEHRKAAEYAQTGVPIALEDVERLEACGRDFGIEPEWDR